MAQNCHFLTHLIHLTQMCFLYQDYVETSITFVPKFLSYLTISLHCKEQPIRKTMSPQSDTHNKDNFCYAIVMLYKGYGQIRERPVASECAAFKSLRFTGNMFLRARMPNHAKIGSQHEVLIVVCARVQDMPHK